MTMAPSTPRTVAGREPFVTKAQVADFFGFTTRWVELRVKHSEMPVHRIGGQPRYRLSELERWAGRQEKTTP